MRRTPTFEQLSQLPGTDERHAWDVWGREDQLGSLNLLSEEGTRSACQSVQRGRVVCLTVPMDEPRPGLFPNRRGYRHNVSTTGHGRDDSLDEFYLQYSSHWDGLQHVRYRQFGYWGGREDEDLDANGTLGIARWAEHGIFGRGVLVDAAGYQERIGEPIDPRARVIFDGAYLETVMLQQGVELKSGDVLVLRTGWMEWYASLSQQDRGSLLGRVGQGDGALAAPGLAGGRDVASWLWDHEVVGVAADNPAVEALPVDRAAGFQHRRLIPLLGMALGEFWWLKELAEECRQEGRYDFLLASAPLHLRGGVGSPANAYAIL